MEILNYIFTENDLIDKGGMGSVYKAHHKFIEGEMAAVKVINANMITDFTRQLLKQEAENLSSLNHPNIVQFKNYHIDEQGNVYLIMEFVEGLSLDQYIRKETGLIVESRICPLFEPILDAVGYAHKRGAHGKGIMHLDIKPSNIMIKKEITVDGEEKIVPKILDFGIAQIIKTGETQNNSEQPKLIMGTPSYMSPEQTKGENLDSRSDIYSLGVLLHQMLIGRPPYDTTTLSEFDINRKVMEDPLPRIKSYYEQHSTRVQKVIDKATAKDRNDRYQTCEEFKKALHEAVYPPKIPVWVKTSIVAAIAIIIGVGSWFWDYNRVKVSYYKDYVEQWGVPVGIHKLTSEEVAHRSQSYRIESRRRKVQRMSLVNSKGCIISHHTTDDIDRPSDCRYFYNEDGKLDYVKIYLQSGRVEMIKDYVNSDLNVAIFRYDDGLGTEKTLGAETVTTFTKNTDESAKKSRISRYLLTYDENGHVTELRYAGFQNVRVADDDGLYGRKYVLDDMGRVREEIFIDQNGNVKATRYGLAIRTREYNDKDDAVRFTYLSPSREPAGEKGLGIPVCHNYVDEWGNTVKQVYESLDGEMMLRRDYNCNAMVTEFRNGEMIFNGLLGLDGNPCYMKGDRYSYHVDSYDEYGFLNKAQFFDIEGKPVLSNGYHSFEYVNDSKGNHLEEWFYDSDGNPALVNGLFSGDRATYDSLGNQTSIMYYGTDKRPVTLSSGISGQIFEYDKMGRKIAEININVDSVPCYNTNHVASIKYDFDPSGNLTKMSFYASNSDSLALSFEGIAGCKITYDEKGNERERRFFDTKENTVVSPSCGYAIRRYYYDQNNYLKAYRYLDADENLLLVNGIAGWDYVNDESGNILERKPIDKNGKQSIRYLAEMYRYENDNCVENALFDANGPAVSDKGVHRYVYAYNDRNKLIEERHYGKDGELVLIDDDTKCAIQKDEYNDKGELVKRIYLGTDEKPCLCKEGWSSSTYEYDALGRIEKECFFGIDGLPTDPEVRTPVRLTKYDLQGNIVYSASQDGHGNFIKKANKTWAIVKSEYDPRGNCIMQALFNENDKPVLEDNSFHKWTAVYNDLDDRVEQAFFGVDSTPVLYNGYHKVIWKYKEKSHQIIELSFWGINDEQVMANDMQFHKMILDYDSDNREILTVSYDTNSELIFMRKTEYDEYGRIKSQTETNGKGVSTIYVYEYEGDAVNANKVKEYDGKGNLTKTHRYTDKGTWELVEDKITELRNFVTWMKSNLPLELEWGTLYSCEMVGKRVQMKVKIDKSYYEMSYEERESYKQQVQEYAINIVKTYGIRPIICLYDKSTRDPFFQTK